MSEDNITPGTGDDPSGTPASHSRRDTETAGSDTTGDGSNPIGSNPDRRQSGKWVGIALALATIVYTVAQLVGIVTGNSDKVEKLNDEINQRAQQRSADAEKLLDTVNTVKDVVNGIPTTLPIPPAIVVQPGTNGAPGKTLVIQPPSTPTPTQSTPAITPTPTPRPTPTPCRVLIIPC